jgi:glycerophosphoryl diester phosphodiesterase
LNSLRVFSRVLGALLLLAGVALVVLQPTAVAQSPGFDLQAHAGGRGETTGESLRAFARSIEIGVNTLEFDINITRDGQPLVWHDPVIDGGQCSDTGPEHPGDPSYPYVGKRVRELSLAQVRTLDCGKPSNEFPHAEVVRGNKITTLPEVFALADSYRSDVRYNIETKVTADQPGVSADPQQFVDVILAAVRAAGKIDRVEIQSFDWRTLPLIHQAEPSIPLVALWNEQTWTAGSPWLAGIDPTVVDPVVGARMVGASVLSPQYTLVGEAFVEHAHALGLKVIPWTVNDAAAIRDQIADGVDGLISDYPSLLRAVMAELGMPPPSASRRA